MKNVIVVRVVLACCVMAACLPLAARAAEVDPVVQTVTAVGSASVSKTPDRVVITLGATATARSSADAQERLNVTMDKVVKAVKLVESPGMEVQTQQISLYAEYERPDGSQHSRELRITGYRATNTVRVTIGDVATAAPIIDAAVAAGANQIQGIAFELKDDSEARKEALTAAARDARAKAGAIAEALGLTVVRVVDAQTGVGAGSPRPMYRGMAMATESLAAATPTQVEPGRVTVTEQVTVTVEVK